MIVPRAHSFHSPITGDHNDTERSSALDRRSVNCGDHSRGSDDAGGTVTQIRLLADNDPAALCVQKGKNGSVSVKR
jgi:hypothetical protein